MLGIGRRRFIALLGGAGNNPYKSESAASSRVPEPDDSRTRATRTRPSRLH
jgi:hypothetical protein